MKGLRKDPRASDARSGLVLIVMAAVLSLFWMMAVAAMRYGAQARAQAAGALDSTAAELASRSGMAYAAARLAENPFPDPGSPSDDWSYRDALAVPLERSLNPSYGKKMDGRADGWSGRLRARGDGGKRFLLKIRGAGGGISVNGGVLGTGDADADGIPDARDPDARGGHPASRPNQRMTRAVDHLAAMLGLSADISGRILAGRPLDGYPSEGSLRSVLTLDEWKALAPYLTVSAQRDARTCSADAAGTLFREPRALVNVNSAPREVLAALQEGLTAHLAVNEYFMENPGWGITTPDTPRAVETGGGSPSAVRAVAVTPGAGSGAVQLPDATLQAYESVPPVRITQADALNAGTFLQSRRPFASRYDLFSRIDLQKAAVFAGALDYRRNLSLQVGRVNGGIVNGQLAPLDVPIPEPQLVLLVQNQCVNLLTENASPARSGLWPSAQGMRAARGPYSWLTYDAPRWAWSDGDTRMPRGPGVESGDTVELALEPEKGFLVESLGLAASGRRVAAAVRREGIVGAMEFVRGSVQADFENLKGSRDMGGGISLKGDPARDCMQSSPLFSLRAWPELESAGDRYRYHEFLGDLRLMDRSDPSAGSPLLYFPFWEPEQPALKSDPSAAGIKSRSGVSKQGSVFKAGAEPSKADPAPQDVILTSDTQGAWAGPGRAGGAHYRWGSGGENAGNVPWVGSGGKILRGAVSFWSDGSACAQKNPMEATMGPRAVYSSGGAGLLPLPRKVSLVLGWSQNIVSLPVVTVDAVSAAAFQQGEWRHVAFSFDALEPPAPPLALGPPPAATGFVRGYLDGIPVVNAVYQANAIDPGKPQEWWAGCPFGDVPVAGEAGVDEIRLYATPAEVDSSALAQALQPRYWPQGEFSSPLHVAARSLSIEGARWDPFVPQVIQAASAGLGIQPIRVWIAMYDNAKGEGTPLKEVELSADGSWKPFRQQGVKAFRYRVRMDAGAVPLLRDTPVFEGIAIAYGCPRLLTLHGGASDPVLQVSNPPGSGGGGGGPALPNPGKVKIAVESDVIAIR